MNNKNSYLKVSSDNCFSGQVRWNWHFLAWSFRSLWWCCPNHEARPFPSTTKAKKGQIHCYILWKTPIHCEISNWACLWTQKCLSFSSIEEKDKSSYNVCNDSKLKTLQGPVLIHIYVANSGAIKELCSADKAGRASKWSNENMTHLNITDTS